jgi:hypothetical protein
MLALFLVAGTANAGCAHEVAHRDLTQPQAAPSIAQYFVEDDSVRVVAPDAKTVVIFKEQTIYVIPGR